MEKNERQLQEQDAPQKNTDNAYVKVGEDGKPEMPETQNQDTGTTHQVTKDGKELHS